MKAALLVLLCAVVAVADPKLIDAVKRVDAAQVRTLIAQHADVNGGDADGSTALHWAAQRDSVEIADLLLAAGANAKAKTRYGVTPLTLACTNGDAAMIEHLIKAGADPNGTSEEGQTSLMTAALTGKADAVRALLAHGANPNVKEPNKGQTALMWAASEGNAAAEAMLIEFGADVKATSTGGFTPLLFAVRNDHIEAAKVLLEHGANVNDAAPDGTGALSMAIINAYFETGGMLVDHGANPNAADPRGSALLSLIWMREPGADGAAGVGNTAKGAPVPEGNMSSLDLAKSLLKHGANPNIRVDWKEQRFGKEGGTAKNPPSIDLGRHYLSYVGATPFYVAAKNGDYQLMRILLDAGADPKINTKAGVTPLMVASGLDYWEGESPGPYTGVTESERLEAVKIAIAAGNDINAHADFGDFPMVGDVGYTLLYYPLNIDELLDKGVGDPRWSGSTPLIGAVVSGQPSIVQYLVDHGAQVDAKTKLGWTPLAVAQGVFFANAKKEFPPAETILKKALAEHGLVATK
jgi:ankyrin repeat protein